MTSTLIFGFFPLLSGVRVSSARKSGEGTTTHVEYDSFLPSGAVQTPCKLRHWISPSGSVLRDNTVAFLVGKMQAPPNEPVLIDVHTMHPVPGDPAGDNYEDSIPDFNTPWVVVLGHATTAAATLPDGISRGFTLTASEYIRGSPLAAPYHARFSGNTSRWNNTPAPHLNTACQVYGPVIAPSEGMFSLDISNITLNIGPLAAAQSTAASQGLAASGSPAKKRRFQITVPSAAVTSSSTAAPANPVASTSANPAVPPATPEVSAVPVADDDETSLTDDAAPVASTKARGKRRAPAS